MERVVLPFSGLASWVLILGGCLATLQVLGINIQPLLTVGGVSGIVVGLSAQSVMSNMISGINLVSAFYAHICCCRLLDGSVQHMVCACVFLCLLVCVSLCLLVCVSLFLCLCVAGGGGGEGGGCGCGFVEGHVSGPDMP